MTRVAALALAALVALPLAACGPAREYRQGEVIAVEEDDGGELQLTVWLDGQERVIDVPDSSDCVEGDTYPDCNGGRQGEFDDEELNSAPRVQLPRSTGTKTIKTKTKTKSTR